MIIEEGAYDDLLESGSMADAKHFFEGKGKALQIKNKTTTGYQWKGVKILMTANHLHRYFQKESHE